MNSFTWSKVEVLLVPTNDKVIVMYNKGNNNTVILHVIKGAMSKGFTEQMTESELLSLVRSSYAQEVLDSAIRQEVI